MRRALEENLVRVTRAVEAVIICGPASDPKQTFGQGD